MINSPRRYRPGWLVAVAIVVGIVVAPSPAEATWSIVATDPETGEVGAAIASCVPIEVAGEPEQPLVPVVVQPGNSVAVTQAQLNLAVPARIQELTEAGETPADILGDLITPEFDEGAELRQHAIASLDGDVVAFTGSENSPQALDAQGDNVSVQGNILVADEVVADALAAFESDRSDGGTLADGLVSGLLAGAEAGGDSRCGEQTALFAQVLVAGPDDDPTAPAILLTVSVDESDGQNPVQLLSSRYGAGERGFFDERADGGTAGLVVRTGVLALGVAMAIVAVYLLMRGMGSVKARR